LAARKGKNNPDGEKEKGKGKGKSKKSKGKEKAEEADGGAAGAGIIGADQIFDDDVNDIYVELVAEEKDGEDED